MQKLALAAALAAFVSNPAAAQDGFPNLVGTWKGDSESIVLPAGNPHHPGKAKGPRMSSVPFTLVVEKQVPKWRNETFDVMTRWGEKPLFRLDRGAVPFFGVRAYGVHLNGYRIIDGQPHLWIGRRAPDKRVAPDKLDNIVAGGIGNGHGVVATLFKESDEEGGIPASFGHQGF